MLKKLFQVTPIPDGYHSWGDVWDARTRAEGRAALPFAKPEWHGMTVEGIH